ncbi:MAG: beta-galactosidase, partial [Phycisphaerales bacterium]|nr:beta-galactosidase [Phycisphaerales bacterium]
MASVTYDGRSFMLDGRRVWIVGGSIHYARLPRAEWAGRIAAARQAGLNTVETPVVWSRHEARPGQFDFGGDNDLRHFVQLVGEAGMHVILRTGPFVGSGYDAGGIPAWLLAQAGVEPRTGSGPFLEACSRYITALAGQIKDLQVTSTGKGGPILLVQSEHAWTCGHEELARAYLGELLRYLREAGISVPVINSNGLWQSVEGEIECWSG